MSIAFVALAFVLAGLALHPFVSYPISLYLIKKLQRHKASVRVTNTGSYALLFCAYNEEASLEQKIENVVDLQECSNGRLIQIGAYSDGSSDRTPELLNRLISSGTDNFVIASSERTGKSNGMNSLMKKVRADFVIFTDANVILDSGVISAFDEGFADPNVGVVCGHLKYINNNTSTAELGTSYWKLEEVIKRLETETGSVMGADGSIFAIRRELFREVPSWIIDDFYTSMQILCNGYRIVRSENAIAFERSVDKLSDENRRKMRIACRAMNCHRILKKEREKLSLFDRYKYFSHKWLRWHTAFFLIGALVSLGIGVFLENTTAFGLYAVLVISGLAIAYIAYVAKVPLLEKAWIVLMSFWSTALGTIHSRQGKTYQTWKPAQSR